MRTERRWQLASWLIALMAIALLASCTNVGRVPLGVDNFERGYNFSSATGLHTGANLEDLFTRGTFAVGAFAADSTNRLFQFPITNLLVGSVSVATIASNSITAAFLADDCVESNEIANDAVNANQIKDGTINTSDCVTGFTLPPGPQSVVATNIADDAVELQHLADSIFPCFRVYNDSTQGWSVVVSDYTNSIYWHKEAFDVGNVYDPTNQYFQIKTNDNLFGIYMFHFSASWDGLGTDKRLWMILNKNGAEVARKKLMVEQSNENNDDVSVMISITATSDYVRAFTYSDDSAVKCDLGASNTFFEGRMVTPYVP